MDQLANSNTIAVVETPQHWNYDVNVNGGDAISNLHDGVTGPRLNLRSLDLQSDMHL